MSEWFVVVERATLEMEPMPPYVVGPYSERRAVLEMASESSVVFALLTIDAKNKSYIAYDCYMTNKPPDGERIIPPTMAGRRKD